MRDETNVSPPRFAATAAGTPPIFRVTDAGYGAIVPVSHEDLDRMAARRPVRAIRTETIPFGWIGRPVGLAGDGAVL